MARGPLAAGGAVYYADMLADALRRVGGSMDDVRRGLDFGCSSGRVARALAACWPEADWHGCDPNRDAIAWARRHLPDVTFQRSPQDPPLPYEDGAFDFVCAISIWSHYGESAAIRWLGRDAPDRAPWRALRADDARPAVGRLLRRRRRAVRRRSSRRSGARSTGAASGSRRSSESAGTGASSTPSGAPRSSRRSGSLGTRSQPGRSRTTPSVRTRATRTCTSCAGADSHVPARERLKPAAEAERDHGADERSGDDRGASSSEPEAGERGERGDRDEGRERVAALLD